MTLQIDNPSIFEHLKSVLGLMNLSVCHEAHIYI